MNIKFKTNQSMNNQLKFWCITLLLSVWSLVSCSDDDNDSEPTLTASEVLQTTWNTCVCDYDIEGKEIVNEEYLIVEFLTENQGKSINGEGSGYPSEVNDLYYHIDGRIITFENSALVGNWTVIEKSKNNIVLQSYRPEKSVATLTKQY